MSRVFKHLTKLDRDKIEKMLNSGEKVDNIAKTIRVDRSTIYREIKRGQYLKKNSYFGYKECYSSDIIQKRYEINLMAKGVELKIGSDYKYANYIESKIADEHYSPSAILGEIKAKDLKFNTSICVTTLYNYIKKDVFLRLTTNNLVVVGKRKNKYKKVITRKHKRLLGNSIEDRDLNIDTRSNFGHWEIDTVKGTKKSNSSLLVFTERKIRKKIIIKLSKHSAEEVVKAIDKLEEKYQDKFNIIFKTIICDNGTEFSYSEEIMKSKLHENRLRTILYYCHPYSSWERGSNEVANRLIRRYITKGKDIKNFTEEFIQKIETLINHYPRKIFEFKSSEELFLKELRLIE